MKGVYTPDNPKHRPTDTPMKTPSINTTVERQSGNHLRGTVGELDTAASRARIRWTHNSKGEPLPANEVKRTWVRFSDLRGIQGIALAPAATDLGEACQAHNDAVKKTTAFWLNVDTMESTGRDIVIDVKAPRWREAACAAQLAMQDTDYVTSSRKAAEARAIHAELNARLIELGAATFTRDAGNYLKLADQIAEEEATRAAWQADVDEEHAARA